MTALLCPQHLLGALSAMSEADSYLLVSGVFKSYPQYAKSSLASQVEAVAMSVHTFLSLSDLSHHNCEAVCSQANHV